MNFGGLCLPPEDLLLFLVGGWPAQERQPAQIT